MKNILAWAMLFCLLQIVPACEEAPVTPVDNAPVDEAPDDAGPLITSLSDCDWLLWDYKYKRLPADLKKKSFIRFKKPTDGTGYLAMGTSFVNHYSAAFTLDEKTQVVFSVDHLISTMMGGTQVKEAAEDFYYKRLEGTKSYRLSGNVLTLNFDNGEVGYFVPKR